MRTLRYVTLIALLVLGACTSGATTPDSGEVGSTTSGPQPPDAVSTTTLPAPLRGATDDDAIPACRPELEPQRGIPAEPSSPVAGPVDLRVVGRAGGEVGAAVLAGQGMYAGSGARVVHLDLSSPGSPGELATSDELPGAVTAFTHLEDLLVVGVAEAGLALLDPKEGLAVVSTLVLPGWTEAVEARGSTVFVADGPGGLRIVDISEPEVPVEQAAVHDLHLVLDVAVDEDLAFLAAGDEGLLVVDVSNPSAPVAVGGLVTGGYGFGVDVLGSHVFLADGWGGVRVVDASNPRAPRLLATLSASGWAMDVALTGNTLLVADGLQLSLHDVSDPAQPVPAGNVPLTLDHAVGVQVGDDLALAVDDTGGLRIVDLAANSPAEVGSWAPLTSASGLAVVDERAYVAALGQGLRVLDMSDSSNPIELTGLVVPDLVRGVLPVGSHLYFSTWPLPESQWVGTLHRIDLTAQSPFDGPLALAGGLGVEASVDGDLVLAASEVTMYVLDLGREGPCILSELRTAEQGFEANGVTIAGDLAYLAGYGGPIRIVDLSDLRNPRLLETTAEGDGVGVRRVLAVASRLFGLGSDGSGPVLAVFDLDDPLLPRLAGTVRLPAEAAAGAGDLPGPYMAWGDGRLFVADEAGGLLVIDVSDLAQPRIAARLRLPGRAVAVVAEDNRAFVAADGGGLFVIEWSSVETAASSREVGFFYARGAGIWTGQQRAESCLVTTTADLGPGSLRDCLANAARGTTISFDPSTFPARQLATIKLTTSLPSVAHGVVVDGIEAGVVIDGGGKVQVGLRLTGEATVRGLTLVHFTTSAVELDGDDNTVDGNVIGGGGNTGISVGGNNNRVTGNLIGLDPTGSRVEGGHSYGIWIFGDDNQIGGPDLADRNVVTGNTIGIALKEAAGNAIQGNFVGTDRSGEVALTPEEFDQFGEERGIMIEAGSPRNRIEGNLVTTGIGVIDPGSWYNTVVGNRVAVRAGGDLFEQGGAIVIDEPFNRVGGSLPGEGNLVNGGIHVQARRVIMLGNRLGVNDSGRSLGESAITSTGAQVIIGGRATGSGNHVATGGMDLTGGLVYAIGNRVNPEQLDEPTQSWGVRVREAIGAQVVGNSIDGGGAGIFLGDGAFHSSIRGNLVREATVGLYAAELSEENLIALNSFVDNFEQAVDLGTGNRWDDGTKGNYWSDLRGADANGDGVWDDPRSVSGVARDRFPLVTPG